MDAYIVADGPLWAKRSLGRSPEDALYNYKRFEAPEFANPSSIDALTIVQLREVHSFPVKQDAALMQLFTTMELIRVPELAALCEKHQLGFSTSFELEDGMGKQNPTNARYIISEDGQTVLDTETRLEWRQAPEPGLYTYEEALAYAETVGNGWRLPTIDELRTLVDISQSGAKIDPQAFPDCPAEWFWSSSAFAYDSSYAWGVDFYDGNDYDYRRDYSYHVRLVRGEQ